MILVVLAFVILTAAAMLDAYGPCVGHAGAVEAAGCFIGLLVFYSLVSWRVASRGHHDIILDTSRLLLHMPILCLPPSCKHYSLLFACASLRSYLGYIEEGCACGLVDIHIAQLMNARIRCYTSLHVHNKETPQGLSMRVYQFISRFLGVPKGQLSMV